MSAVDLHDVDERAGHPSNRYELFHVIDSPVASYVINDIVIHYHMMKCVFSVGEEIALRHCALKKTGDHGLSGEKMELWIVVVVDFRVSVEVHREWRESDVAVIAAQAPEIRSLQLVIDCLMNPFVLGDDDLAL